MLFRISFFIFCQLLGGVAGWFVASDRGAAAGMILGGIVWFLIDIGRAMRVVNWLRRPDLANVPALPGVWGQLVERARRALRLSQQEVQEAQGRLQEFLAAIQASPNGVVLLDARGRIEWCNQMAAEQLGFNAERDIKQLIGNLVRDPAFTAYYVGEDYAQEIVIEGRESTPGRPVRIAVHLHPYGAGRKLLLSRDITAVQQAETMRRDFVANVSHEIRTPLTVLAGFVETLQTLPLSGEDRSRYLGLMAQQAGRMQTLVDDLLTLSRLEGSPLPGASEWTPVAALLAQCEQEGRALASVLGKAQQLQFDAAPAGLDIAGAPNELLSAMTNLVSNAIRYTPPHGSIEVLWRMMTDGRCEFAVRDTGPGIAPEHISRLTERFYRVDRSRSRETGGTGLGLAIVKHVIQRHGGTLHIESAVGAGSTFALRFPAHRLREPLRLPQDAAQPATAVP